ncbi:hypothetical protein ACFYKX_11660 [Cytobacillus sp. FJAT-54145]|uniref:Uncharacterized protein n=1 Tax=Cytobacillus spartinae TaxID=3299023 RepID=A0ABW6KED5_9BACI
MSQIQAIQPNNESIHPIFSEIPPLPPLRNGSEVDLCRLARQGLLRKGKKGYQKREEGMSMFGEVEEGEWFWIEESIQYVKKGYEETAQELMEVKREWIKGSSFVPFSKILKLEHTLRLYLILWEEAEPFFFRSPRQLEDWIDEHSTLECWFENLLMGDVFDQSLSQTIREIW